MKKIKKGQEKLTPEQEAYAKVFAQKCIQVYLSTEKVDEQVAEYHLANIYKVAGLKVPKKIIWVDSPKEFIKVMTSVGASVRASVWDSVRDSVWVSVGDSVGDSVWDSVKDSVRDSVRDSVWVSVGDSVGDSVWDSVKDSVKDSVRDSVRVSVGASVGDSVDSWWNGDEYSFFGFFNENFEENKLSHLFELSKLVNGYFFGDKGAILCRKPIRLNLENGKLHSTDSMAIEWQDGYGFYFLNGISFEKELWEKVTNKTLSAKEAMKLENTEQRAVVIKMLGTKKVLDELGSVVLDEQTFGYGTDYLLQLKDFKDSVGDDYKILKGFDPAENDFVYIRVSPECKTVQEAQTFAYQLTGLNITYNPILRT